MVQIVSLVSGARRVSLSNAGRITPRKRPVVERELSSSSSSLDPATSTHPRWDSRVLEGLVCFTGVWGGGGDKRRLGGQSSERGGSKQSTVPRPPSQEEEERSLQSSLLTENRFILHRSSDRSIPTFPTTPRSFRPAPSAALRERRRRPPRPWKPCQHAAPPSLLQQSAASSTIQSHFGGSCRRRGCVSSQRACWTSQGREKTVRCQHGRLYLRGWTRRRRRRRRTRAFAER